VIKKVQSLLKEVNENKEEKNVTNRNCRSGGEEQKVEAEGEREQVEERGEQE
jgi:hypothetical protein